jgi:protein-S-isoprenylcysteine O-methyltransferase Ste14
MTEAKDPLPMSRGAVAAYAVGLPLAFLVLVFLPVGRIGWAPGWLFVGITVVAFGLSGLVLARVNPVIYRARSRFQPGTESWDLRLLAIILPAMVAEIPLATLDAGRMHWSQVPVWVVILGYVLLCGGIAVSGWAQAVNPFFEPGVRLQRERHQRVISAGPYAFVRHPGYGAALAIFAGIPLALASWWALLPAALAGALLIVRTFWEDRLLQSGLAGYPDYARRTRYRLVPGLW